MRVQAQQTTNDFTLRLRLHSPRVRNGTKLQINYEHFSSNKTFAITKSATSICEWHNTYTYRLKSSVSSPQLIARPGLFTKKITFYPHKKSIARKVIGVMVRPRLRHRAHNSTVGASFCQFQNLSCHYLALFEAPCAPLQCLQNFFRPASKTSLNIWPDKQRSICGS